METEGMNGGVCVSRISTGCSVSVLKVYDYINTTPCSPVYLTLILLYRLATLSHHATLCLRHMVHHMNRMEPLQPCVFILCDSSPSGCRLAQQGCIRSSGLIFEMRVL